MPNRRVSGRFLPRSLFVASLLGYRHLIFAWGSEAVNRDLLSLGYQLMTLLEIACFNPESALVASESGADRIELCADADLGGTTPRPAWLTEIRSAIQIPIHIMIRPRGGDFVYSAQEFKEMKDATIEFKPMADGFVFGILVENGTVDKSRTSELVELAYPLPCTFHRAFDETPDLFQALEDGIQCGVKTILTSGGGSAAIQRRGVLAQLVEKAGTRVVLMPGGGVRSTNIEDLQSSTGAPAYHSSALFGPEKVASSVEIGRMSAILRRKQ